VFQWLRAVGRVRTDDMLQTFNCGLGMVVVVAPIDIVRVTAALSEAGESVQEIGVIERAPGSEADCVVDHVETLWRN
jgi:phosphoribosylformylglycinamidine cyclo-ligase